MLVFSEKTMKTRDNGTTFQWFKEQNCQPNFMSSKIFKNLSEVKRHLDCVLMGKLSTADMLQKKNISLDGKKITQAGNSKLQEAIKNPRNFGVGSMSGCLGDSVG